MATVDLRNLTAALRVQSGQIKAFGGELAARSMAFIATTFRAETPADTGRARASTIVSAGTPRFSAPMPGRGPFQGQFQFGPAIRAIRGGSTGYLSQAARQREGKSYSPYLDLGSSPKARGGMTKPTLAKYVAELPAIAKSAASAAGMRP